jgi:hypothetical protein
MSEQKNELTAQDLELNGEDVQRAHRPAVMDFFVQLGKELFCREMEEDDLYRPSQYKETNVMYWLMFECQSRGVLISRPECNDIVYRVLTAANNVVDAGQFQLTVGALKQRLEGLPENMPVLYERINDESFTKGWTTISLVSSKYEAHEGDIAFVNENPSEYHDLYTENDKVYYRSFGNYISAFSAYGVTDKEGKKAFVLTAHY